MITGATAILLTVACGSSDSDVGSADEFVRVSGFDRSVDFEPLASPKQALDVGDLVVAGEVQAIDEGMTVLLPNEQPSPPSEEPTTGDSVPLEDQVTDEDAVLPDLEPRFQTSQLSVRVTDVLKGDDSLVGEVLSVQIYRSPLTSFNQVRATEFTGRAVFVLEDISDWVPTEGAVFKNRPDEPIYLPYTDGGWFEGENGLVAVEAEADDLAAAWGNPRSVDAIVAVLRSASGD